MDEASAAQKLQENADMELRELNMPQVKFAVQMELGNPRHYGMDQVDCFPQSGEMHSSRIASEEKGLVLSGLKASGRDI